ncbi:ESCRT-1 complex, Vps28 subunit [Pelomyxa schiedti]|nr:ESCRT-1 complex, Vps28 subunit [Pelomyxa schiedti]
MMNTATPPSYSEATGASPPPITEEVRLFTTAREREMYSNKADLFAIIKTMEHLEKAFVRDLIAPTEYEAACKNLITQYKGALVVVASDVPDVAVFMKEYGLECPAAVQRFKVGVPATIEHGKSVPSRDGSNNARVVAETVQSFITAMDAVKLGVSDVDQLFPLLTELLECITKNVNLPQDFEPRQKVTTWLKTLNAMKASDKLSEEDSRQLMFDLEQGYSQFHKSLDPKRF